MYPLHEGGRKSKSLQDIHNERPIDIIVGFCNINLKAATGDGTWFVKLTH